MYANLQNKAVEVLLWQIIEHFESYKVDYIWDVFFNSACHT